MALDRAQFQAHVVAAKDAKVHRGRMNSISWIVGHLAWQEQRYLLVRPQKIMLRRDIQTRFTTGGKMSTSSTMISPSTSGENLKREAARVVTERVRTSEWKSPRALRT